MARVLAISSYVVQGHVGLGAIVPALHRLGHEVVSMPSVVLSNHPGHGHFAGDPVAAERLYRMLDALEANGMLDGLSAVLTGYLPSLEHVRFAAAAAARVSARNPEAAIYCDPVLGDNPHGLYIDQEAAAAIRDELVPIADLIFPNRFELAYLSRQAVDDVGSALEAARDLPVRAVVATSIAAEPGMLANLLMVGGDAVQCTVPQRASVPHGTGDLLAALFVGHRLRGGRGSQHLASAVAGVEAAIAVSLGAGDLRLIGTADWANASPLPADPL